MERVLFWIFGAVAVLASLWMVTRRNPLSSALSLVVAFLSLAALYAILHAHLLFAIQLWVYAGAVVVLAVAWKAFQVLRDVEIDRPAVDPAFGSVAGVSEILFTRWVLQFE